MKDRWAKEPHGNNTRDELAPNTAELDDNDDEIADDFDLLLRDAFKLPPGPEPGAGAALLRCLRCKLVMRLDAPICPEDGGPMVPVGDERIGTVVGPYRIVECLGSGGIGTVYRARHRTLGTEAAVKYLRPEFAEHGEHRARLEREATVIGQLEHEHIVRVIDFMIPARGSPLLVLEFVRGRTLAAALQQHGPLPATRALHITRQIARALARAHRLGVLHRDIKPSNVLLTRVADDTDFVKVLDFGIARAPTSLELTGSHAVIGTPQYMSPEQAQRKTLGPESDLYSLGCVLFELLTGLPPFTGSPAMVMYAHAHDRPPALAKSPENLTDATIALVSRLLQKNPEQRFRDAHQLIRALDQELPSLPRRSLVPIPQTPSYHPEVSPEQELEQRLVEQAEHLERSMVSTGKAERALDEIRAMKAALSELSKARELLAAAAGRSNEQQAARTQQRRALLTALDALSEALSKEELEQAALEQAAQHASALQAQAVQAVCRFATRDEAGPTHARDNGDLRRLQQAVDHLAHHDEKRHQAEAALAQCDARRTNLSAQLEHIKEDLSARKMRERADTDAELAQCAALHVHHQAALERAAAAVDTLCARLLNS